MKRVKIVVQVDMGVFNDNDDLSQERLIKLYRIVDRPPWISDTLLQIVVTDMDTNLISNLIPIGESDT
jgi:hypothetical protein